jgi:hypothetical protein
VDTLDAYVTRTGRAPAVLKVDTETTEPDVLTGGRALLERHRPWIVCEVLAGRTGAQLEAILGPLGYRYFHLPATMAPVEHARIEGDPSHLERDWLFTPGPLPERFLEHHAAWRAALAATRR